MLVFVTKVSTNFAHLGELEWVLCNFALFSRDLCRSCHEWRGPKSSCKIQLQNPNQGRKMNVPHFHFIEMLHLLLLLLHSLQHTTPHESRPHPKCSSGEFVFMNAPRKQTVCWTICSTFLIYCSSLVIALQFSAPTQSNPGSTWSVMKFDETDNFICNWRTRV